MRRVLLPLLLLAITIPYLSGKDAPFQVVTWPESGQPALRFTFSKFKEMGGMGREHTYVTDTIAENLSDQTIGSATFSLYVFDKNKARIGEGNIYLTNVSAGQTVKFQITLTASDPRFLDRVPDEYVTHCLCNCELSSAGRFATCRRQGNGHDTEDC
jgi:hypothetical protein